MSRRNMALLFASLVAVFLAPEHTYAQRFKRRAGTAVHMALPQRVNSHQYQQVTPRVHQPLIRIHTREGFNEYGERYYITTHDEGDWKYHEGVDPEGKSFTGHSFDWGGGYISHELEADNGKRYRGHSFDWGDGYSTYSFKDEEGNEIEFHSHDLELESAWDRW